MTPQEEDNLRMFLDGLTELSRRHRLGITGQPVLFVMEDDDNDRSYSADDESNIIFR